MKSALFALSLVTLFGCSGKEKSKQATVADSVEAPVATTYTPSSDKTLSKNGSVAGADKWVYEQTTDPEGRTVYKASITSPNLLEFDFPYAGGSTATLTIRKRERDTHVYIRVSKGQFNRSYQGGTARVRFDGHQPIPYALSAAENGSANILFFDSDQELISRMKAARNMVVDVEFAEQGKRHIAFRTANLTWDR